MFRIIKTPLLLLAGILVFCLIAPPRFLKKYGINKSFPAEDIALQDLNGDQINLHDYKGFPVILYMWGSWCPASQERLQMIDNIYQATKNSPVIFLAVTRGDREDKLRQFINTTKIQYPVYMPFKPLAKGYKTTDIPFMYLINKNGIVKDNFNPIPEDTEKILKWVRKELDDETSTGPRPKPKVIIPSVAMDNRPPIKRHGYSSTKDMPENTENMLAEYKITEELFTRITELRLHGQIDELDKLADQLRSGKTDARPGLSQLQAFYLYFSGSIPNEEYFQDHLRAFSTWAKLRPNSITARVLLGSLWERYAWYGRGTGYGNQLTPEQSRLFKERVIKAREILEEAEKLPNKCPMLYAELQAVALDQGWDRQQYESLFRKALQLDPLFTVFYQRKITYLMHYWYGEEMEWTSVLNDAVEATRQTEQTSFYALLMCECLPPELQHSKKIFKQGIVTWPKLRQGFLDAVNRHPNSLQLKNQFAFYASMMQDKETARSVFAVIGDSYDVYTWRNRTEFLQSKRWAEQ